MTRYLPRSAPATLLLAAALVTSAAGGAVAGGMITGAQIKDGTVSTRDVKDGTLKSADLSAPVKAKLGTVPFTAVQSMGQPVPPGSAMSVEVVCPSGTVVIGGDAVVEVPADAVLQDSGPLDGGDVGWFVTVGNTGGTTQLVSAIAHCANLG